MDSTFIGVGGCKTAQTGLLMLTLPTTSRLGSKPHQEVVVKQPFFSPAGAGASSSADKQPANRRITCFALLDELVKLHREANTLYWSQALLKMMYEFIDRAIDDRSGGWPSTI